MQPSISALDAFKAWDGNGIQLTAQLSSSGDNPIRPIWNSRRRPGHRRARRCPHRLARSHAESIAAGEHLHRRLPEYSRTAGFLDSPHPGTQGDSPLADVQPGVRTNRPIRLPLRPWDAIAATDLTNHKDDQTLFQDSFVRGPALVLPVPPQSPSAALFTLGWVKQCVSGTNQNLTLTISATAAGGNATDVMVIDPQPFTMARVQLPGLASTASAITNQVAVFSNSFPEGPGWRIAAGAGSFQMLLPPQGIGEEMIKGQLLPPDTPDRPMQFGLRRAPWRPFRPPPSFSASPSLDGICAACWDTLANAHPARPFRISASKCSAR